MPLKSCSPLFLNTICPKTAPAVHNKFSNTISSDLVTYVASKFRPRQFLQLHPESTCRWFSALFIYLKLTVATRRLGRKPWSWSGSVAHKPVVRRRPGFNPGLRHFTRHVYFLLFVLILLLVLFFATRRLSQFVVYAIVWQGLEVGYGGGGGDGREHV